MSASVNHLEERLLDERELLEGIMPSAITLAMMLRHRQMATWLRAEFDGYPEVADAPPYRRDLPGHVVARSPQYGWIPAPLEDDQKIKYGRLDLIDGVKSLEQICLGCRKGNGHRVLLAPEALASLQKQVNLTAELAINVSREVYCRLLKTVRASLYLWTRALAEQGLSGEHNHYSAEERARVAELDRPDHYWRRAMAELESLPVPDVREAGLLERLFGPGGLGPRLNPAR